MEINIETLVLSGSFQVRFGSHQRTSHIRTVELHNNDELYFFEEKEGSLAKHVREKVYVDGAHVIDCGCPGKNSVEVLALFLKDYDYAERVDTLGNRKDTIFERGNPSAAGGTDDSLSQRGQFAVLLGSRAKMTKCSFLKALQKASHEYTSFFLSPVGTNAPSSLPRVRNRFDDVVRGTVREEPDDFPQRARSSSSSSAVSVLSDHEVLQLEDVLRAYAANQAGSAEAVAHAEGSSVSQRRRAQREEEEQELPLAPADSCSTCVLPSGVLGATVPKRLLSSPLFHACLEGQPANLACADCDEPFPTWCVLRPFGVFVCIDCVGVHRRLWANRCREAEMDKWSDKDVEYMASRGNAVVNGELEFHIAFPPGSVEANTQALPPRKPYHHISKSELRESYIRWKYEEQLFTQAAHPPGTAPLVPPPRDDGGVNAGKSPAGEANDAAACLSPSAVGSFSPPPGDDVGTGLAPPRYTGFVKLILKELNADACFVGSTCVISNGFQELHSRPGRKLMSIVNATAWDESMQIGIENPHRPLFCAVYNAKEQLMAAAEFRLPQPIIDGTSGMITISLPWCQLDKKPSCRSGMTWQLTALAGFSELQ